MRMIALVTLSAALLACTACSDPECGEYERKIGKTCFPFRHDSDAATSPSTGQASASTGQANASDSGGGLSGVDGGSGSGIDGGSSGAQSPTLASDSQVPLRPEDASSTGTPSVPAVPPPCDGGVVNACNGCDTLTHTVAEACSNDGQGPCALMGTYQCFAEQLVCNAPKGMASTEVCDGIDNDCNGKTDEGLLNACKACGAVPVEVCDGVDNNCDGQVDEGLLNACKKCGPVPEEVCDGVDNNCDGRVDEGVLNVCKRCGAVPAEVCDGYDNNCNGAVDEADATDAPTWYPDCDGDGYAVLEGSVKSCAAPAVTAGCKAYLKTAPVAGTTMDCQDHGEHYHPGSEWGTTTDGAAPPTNGPLYDFDCNGVVELASYFLDYGPPSAVVPKCKTWASPACETCAVTENFVFDPRNCAAQIRVSGSVQRVVNGTCTSSTNANLTILCR